MEDVVEKWFNRDYEFFATNMIAAQSAGPVIASYSILEIMENSIKLFIDYTYKNAIPIRELRSENLYLDNNKYVTYTFDAKLDENTRISLAIAMRNDKVFDLSFAGYKLDDFGSMREFHQESLSSGNLSIEAVQMRAAQLIKIIKDYILSDVNLEAYFIVQGINVRNYDI